MAQTYFVTGVKLTFPVPRTPGLVRPEWNDYLHFRCYPLKRKPTQNGRAWIDTRREEERERDLWTRSENEIDRDPESRPSNLFFLLLQEDFSPSFVSILARINLPSDRSIDLEMSNTNIHIFIILSIIPQSPASFHLCYINNYCGILEISKNSSSLFLIYFFIQKHQRQSLMTSIYLHITYIIFKELYIFDRYLNLK